MSRRRMQGALYRAVQGIQRPQAFRLLACARAGNAKARRPHTAASQTERLGAPPQDGEASPAKPSAHPPFFGHKRERNRRKFVGRTIRLSAGGRTSGVGADIAAALEYAPRARGRVANEQKFDIGTFQYAPAREGE